MNISSCVNDNYYQIIKFLNAENIRIYGRDISEVFLFGIEYVTKISIE